MQLNNLKTTYKRKKSRQVGRGGKRGKTSGRGTKGQKARAGRKLRPEMRDIIKRLPKRRGYRFGVVSAKPVAINLKDLEANFISGDEVTPKILLEKGLLKKKDFGRGVKILGSGSISKKIKISNCSISQSAKASLEKVGGQVLSSK